MITMFSIEFISTSTSFRFRLTHWPDDTIQNGRRNPARFGGTVSIELICMANIAQENIVLVEMK